MELAITVLVGVAGMLVHFWKRKIRKQTISGLKEYITANPVYTIMALSATIGASSLLAPASIDLTNIPALIGVFTPAFTAGYMCDSAINKAVDDS